jgi:hypothetical protein
MCEIGERNLSRHISTVKIFVAFKQYNFFVTMEMFEQKLSHKLKPMMMKVSLANRSMRTDDSGLLLRWQCVVVIIVLPT